MATKREIKMTVVGEVNGYKHLERAPIIGIGDKKGNNAFHKAEAADQSAILSLINSFKLNANSLLFEIEWKPSSDQSLLFNNLRSKKSNLTLFIYWFISDSGKLRYSEVVVVGDGKVNKPAQSKGTAPNAVQHVEFTGKLKPK